MLSNMSEQSKPTKTLCAMFPPTMTPATTCAWLSSSYRSNSSNNKTKTKTSKIKTKIKTKISKINKIRINLTKISKISNKAKTSKASKIKLNPSKVKSSKHRHNKVRASLSTWMSAVCNKCSKPCKTRRKPLSKKSIKWENSNDSASVKPLATSGKHCPLESISITITSHEYHKTHIIAGTTTGHLHVTSGNIPCAGT